MAISESVPLGSQNISTLEIKSLSIKKGENIPLPKIITLEQLECEQYEFEIIDSEISDGKLILTLKIVEKHD